MTSASHELIDDLKRLVVDVCEKDIDPAGIADDELLFGPDARLELDSLDALQLSMALQKRYGVRLPDSKETRRVMASIATLAEFLAAHK
ncbi:MAG: acyl carrier protein [Burkholderiales bacterium RIFCSPLOWO2_02_FULL_57_36]|nr:MAG: acyl carrier protein [Burkholderiales bacterium RIFCSPLOWO2_02_FULL_57_36]